MSERDSMNFKLFGCPSSFYVAAYKDVVDGEPTTIKLVKYHKQKDKYGCTIFVCSDRTDCNYWQEFFEEIQKVGVQPNDKEGWKDLSCNSISELKMLCAIHDIPLSDIYIEKKHYCLKRLYYQAADAEQYLFRAFPGHLGED